MVALDEPHTKSAWVHLSCQYWIPGVECDYTSGLVTGLTSIDPSRFNMICEVCNTSRAKLIVEKGACIQCAAPGCMRSFHVECARRSLVDLPFNFVDIPHWRLYCDSHSKAYVSKRLEDTSTASKGRVLKYVSRLHKQLQLTIDTLDHTTTNTVDYYKFGSIRHKPDPAALKELNEAMKLNIKRVSEDTWTLAKRQTIESELVSTPTKRIRLLHANTQTTSSTMKTASVNSLE